MVMDSKGAWHWEKVPGHERNEALDCRNYANAAFRVLHPNLNYIKAKLNNEQNLVRTVKRQQRKRKQEDDIW
jgi:phage terminase large subunit GpA-like protein